jgi:hypothetical protein
MAGFAITAKCPTIIFIFRTFPSQNACPWRIRKSSQKRGGAGSLVRCRHRATVHDDDSPAHTRRPPAGHHCQTPAPGELADHGQHHSARMAASRRSMRPSGISVAPGRVRDSFRSNKIGSDADPAIPHLVCRLGPANCRVGPGNCTPSPQSGRVEARIGLIELRIGLIEIE